MILRNLSLVFILLMFLFSCGGSDKPATDAPPPQSMLKKKEDPMKNKGIGPVTSVELGAIDSVLVAEGQAIYEDKCTLCHKPYDKYIGPAPAGILERRTPEWTMNMILNPEEMLKKDPIAKELLREYNGALMVGQGLTEQDARAVLEYMRTL